MDRNTIMIRLNQLFSNWNQKEKLFQKVWIEDGIPAPKYKRYKVNVQLFDADTRFNMDPAELSRYIRQVDNEVGIQVSRTIIHDFDDRAYCKWDEIVFIDHQSYFLPLLQLAK